MSEPNSVSYFTPTYYPAADWHATGAPPSGGVTIVGGGPVGLITALGLADRGIQVTVLERKGRVGLGSKAVALGSRSLEVLAALGVSEPFLEKGLPWDSGRSFYRGKEISRFRIPAADRQHASLTNLPQPFMEAYLVDACDAHPNVEIRWHTEVTGVESRGESATLTLATANGEYTYTADWVVACDGARSAVRKALGLPLAGTTYTNSFVICDIRMTSARSTERLCWFDPPAFPGRTVLLHQLTTGLWRIDFQISESEDPGRMTDPAVVAPLVQRHFDYIGEDCEWEIEWLSQYRAHARSLESYRHERVLFAGDAAHLLPIFGVRGLNSGIADSVNLVWKLALVAAGRAAESLLDTYSREQRDFFEQNRAYADHSTLYMTPGTEGTELVRNASLDLALVDPDLEFLADPSYSTPLDWTDGPLVRPATGDWSTGPAGGALVENLRIGPGGGFLNDLIGPWFTLLSVGTVEPAVASDLVSVLSVAPDGPLGKYLGGEGAVYLLRPDRHVLQRWRAPGRPALTDEIHAELERLGIAGAGPLEEK